VTPLTREWSRVGAPGAGVGAGPLRGRLLAFFLLLSGCSSTNLADVIQAAAKDEATVCARVTSVYGTLTYLRTNVHGGDVACDTLGVKSTTNISVPMTITPSFQVAPNAFGPGTQPVVPQAAPLSRSDRRIQAEPKKGTP